MAGQLRLAALAGTVAVAVASSSDLVEDQARIREAMEYMSIAIHTANALGPPPRRPAANRGAAEEAASQVRAAEDQLQAAVADAARMAQLVRAEAEANPLAAAAAASSMFLVPTAVAAALQRQKLEDTKELAEPIAAVIASTPPTASYTEEEMPAAVEEDVAAQPWWQEHKREVLLVGAAAAAAALLLCGAARRRRRVKRASIAACDVVVCVDDTRSNEVVAEAAPAVPGSIIHERVLVSSRAALRPVPPPVTTLLSPAHESPARDAWPIMPPTQEIEKLKEERRVSKGLTDTKRPWSSGTAPAAQASVPNASSAAVAYEMSAARVNLAREAAARLANSNAHSATSLHNGSAGSATTSQAAQMRPRYRPPTSSLVSNGPPQSSQKIPTPAMSKMQAIMKVKKAISMTKVGTPPQSASSTALLSPRSLEEARLWVSSAAGRRN
eukprot:TRINITY_DN27160_c0_g1_i1.p1 TRINITY_DN27160_c0_g1~~TRINITY_DN27160_c0_g1_i1.p1  ORF type:complete len:442 (-),score=97.82 TRINITY_DN27160_c0_g1_i1:62-1387(-)